MLTKEFLEKNRDKYFFALISFAVFVCSMIFGWKQGLWADELDTLKSLHLRDMAFEEWLFSLKSSSNIFFVTSRVWAEIGELVHIYNSDCWDKWLLVLPSLLGAIATYYVGLIGSEIINKETGYVSSVIFAFSYTGLYNAMEFRYYPWQMCFTAMSFYFYCKIFKSEQPKIRDVVVYGVAMGLCVNSQIINVWGFVFLGILDFVFIVQKKRQIKILTSYIIGMLLSLPFAYYLVTSLGATKNSILWDGGDPTFEQLCQVISTMIDNDLLTLIFYAAIAYAIIYYRENKLFSINTFIVLNGVLLNWFFTNIVTCIMGEDPNTFMGRYMQYLFPLISISIGGMIVIMLQTLLKERLVKSIYVVVITLVVWLLSLNAPKILSEGGPMKGGVAPYTDWLVEHYEQYGKEAVYVLYEANDLYREVIKENYIQNNLQINDIYLNNGCDMNYLESEKPEWLIIDNRCITKYEIEGYYQKQIENLPDFGRKIYIYHRND